MRKCLLLTVVALAVNACSNPLEQNMAVLTEARARWANVSAATYEINFMRSGCECLPEWGIPVRLRVMADSVISAVRRSDGAPVAEEDLHLFLTVEDVFERIEEAIAANAFLLVVEYDEEFGFPLMVQLDIDEGIADDEVTFAMGELEVVTRAPVNP